MDAQLVETTPDFRAVASAGSFRVAQARGVHFDHRWTAEGVDVEAEFTGAHLLLLAAAGCVLNDLYREAEGLGIELQGVRVAATGSFDVQTWHSTGIGYTVELDADAGKHELTALLDRVDAVAEIPRALRAGATVARAT